MPSVKEKIELIATEILFSDFSISYKVKINYPEKVSGVVFCHENIKEKDLMLNPTFIDENNNLVVFVVINVIPHFYSDILDRKIKDFTEYESELDKIYSVGEVVGYILKEENNNIIYPTIQKTKLRKQNLNESQVSLF